MNLWSNLRLILTEIKLVINKSVALLVLLWLTSLNGLFAQTTYYSRAPGGNWNSNSSWSTVAFDNPTNTGTFPLAGDIVLIGGTGSTISVASVAACASINIANSSVLNVANGLIVSGAVTVGGGSSGVLSITSTAGSKDFGGLVTINAGAIWDETADEAIVFRGGITNSGTFNAGGGLHTFSTNSQTLTGIFSIPRVRVNGQVVVLTNTNSLTVNTDLIGTGRLTQASNAVLNLGGISTINNLTSTANGNTVNYSGSGQTVYGSNYFNLSLSGSGVKTLQAGTTSIGGNLTLTGTASTTAVVGLTIAGNVDIGLGTTFTGGNVTHNLAGDWTNNGTFTAGGSTINLNGGAQIIAGGGTTFNDLLLSGSGNKTISVSTTISGTLSIDNGAVANLDNARTYTSNALLLGGAIKAAGTWGSSASNPLATNVNDTFFSGTGLVTVTSGVSTYYSIASADWNLPSTWSTVGFGGPAALTTPGASNFVFIGDDKSVSITGTETCAALLFAEGTGNPTNNSLTIMGGSLTVSGSVTIPQKLTFGSNVLDVASGNLTAASLDFTATGGGAGHRMTISTGTATITGNVTGIGASSTINFTGGGLLRVGGSMFAAANGTLTAPSGTVEYNGAAQTVQALAYNHLTLSGSGNKTLAANTTLGGNLSVGVGTSFLVGRTLSVGGSTTVSGTLSITSTSGNKSFGGLVTVNPGAVWNEAVNEAIVFLGGITNNGTFNTGLGLHTFTTNSQVLTGTFSIPNVRVNGATVVLTNTNSLTVNTDLTGTGRLTQASNAVLNIGNNSTISNITATANGNTVNYTGAGQSIHSSNYFNLGLSGTGAKTLQTGTTSIGGNFTLSGTASTIAVAGLAIGGSISLGAGTSFTGGAFTHSLGGNWTNNGTFTGTGSTINFNGAAQNVTGNAISVDELQLSGTGTKTLGVSTTISGSFSIDNGVVANLSNSNTYTSDFLLLGGALQIAGTWGSTSSPATNKDDTFFSGSGFVTVANGNLSYYSIASTDWNLNTTWSIIGFGGPPAPSTPGANNFVFIGGGNTVTVTGNESCAALSFDAGTSVTNTLTISNSLTVSGAITIPQTVTSGSNILNVGAGNLTAGALDFTATGSGAGHQMTISTGTATISGNVTGIGASSSINFTGAGSLQLGGSIFNASNGTLTAPLGTVEFNGTDQSIPALLYNNLTLTGSGNKTVATGTTIGGNLNVGVSTNFIIDAVTITVNGSSTVNGTLSITSSTGTKIFEGLVTVNGTWNNTDENVTFRGGITNTGTFNAGSGMQIFGTNSQALTGIFSIPTININGASIVLTNNNTLTVNTDLGGSGRLTQGAGALLNVGGNFSVANLTATANGNTINYTGVGQTVRNSNYHNLSLSGNGAFTLQAGTTSIAGDFTLAGTASTVAVTGLSIGGSVNIGPGTSFTAGAFSHAVGGDWTNNGTFAEAGSTINFNGTGAQNILGSSSFNNLSINSSGIVALLSPQNLLGQLSLGATSSFDAGPGLLTLISTSDTQSANVGEIQNGATFNGSIVAQRFMGMEGAFNRYVSSPVTGSLLSDLTSGFVIIRDLAQTYNEPATGGFNSGYVNVTMGSTLVSGKGYLIKPKAPFDNMDITWDVTGPLTVGFNRGNVDLNPTYTNNGDPDADGWNLVGNPYPSAIVWDGNPANWDIQDIEPIVYVPDVANPSYFMSFDYSTGLGVPGLGTLAGGVIAMGQAFWVRAQGPALSPSLVVHESAKTSASGEFYRRRTVDNNGLSVTLSDNIGKDISWLMTKPDALDGYDAKYDRSKLEPPALSVSFLVEDRKLVNSTVHELGDLEIPLIIKVNTDGEFSLNFEEIGNLPEFGDLYLVDNEFSNAHKISSGSYSFTTNGGTEISNRFFLSKKEKSSSSTLPVVSMYPNPVIDLLRIMVYSEEAAKATIVDASGAVLMEGRPDRSANNFQTITFDMGELAKGFYLIKTQVGGKSVTRKIVKN